MISYPSYCPGQFTSVSLLPSICYFELGPIGSPYSSPTIPYSLFSGPIFYILTMGRVLSVVYSLLVFLSLRCECVLNMFLDPVEEYNSFVYFQASGGFISLLLPLLPTFVWDPFKSRHLNSSSILT